MKELDLEYNDEAVCPHCGYKNYIESEQYKGDNEYFEDECGGCEEPFEVCCNYEITFSSRKIGD